MNSPARCRSGRASVGFQNLGSLVRPAARRLRPGPTLRPGDEMDCEITMLKVKEMLRLWQRASRRNGLSPKGMTLERFCLGTSYGSHGTPLAGGDDGAVFDGFAGAGGAGVGHQ